jgi:NAD(P)-dependent dehydrogenase (short-subunit alcohol dehydrogenase family)
VAKSFIAAGARVAITGRRAEGKDIAAAIGASFITCDATDERAVVQLRFNEAEAMLGKLSCPGHQRRDR